jgi:plastocyanin
MKPARNISKDVRFWIAMAVVRFGMAASVALVSLSAAAADRPAEAAPPTAAEFAQLKREVAEQRQLLIQMMQVEQQRYDMLLRLLQSGGQAPPTALPPPMTPPGGTSATTPAPASSAAASTSSGKSGGGERVGVVTGRVDARSGTLKEAYVYVDIAKGSSGRGHTLEIKQKDKQFWPQTSVVLRGTSVSFPNLDAVFHSVFSTSGRNSFDLGSYRSGDPARSVTLTTPGVVEVFCNIHAKMNANILVVPGPLYTKVGADGSYRIENVPVGARRIVAWSPNAKPAQQKIEVSGSGGQANFTLDIEGAKQHTNKLGQPYGSYKE